MTFGNFGRNTFSSYSKVQFFFLLQFLLTSISSTRREDLTSPVKRNFIVPKDFAAKTINELQNPAPIDYIPLLSKKVAAVASSPLAPTVSNDTFSFFSNDTREAADIVREAAKSSSGPEEAIDKLVQVSLTSLKNKINYNEKTVETFFLERLLLQLRWPVTNKEVPLRVLIDKVLQLKIASDKIYRGKLGGVPMSSFSSK